MTAIGCDDADTLMEPTSPTQMPHKMEDRDGIGFTVGALRELEEHLYTLDQETNKLQHKLGALERQRNLVKQHIDIRESFYVPINKLPRSLLRSIFNCCLPYGQNPIMSNHEAPMSLSQVCRRWRQTAVDSPELWASIHISVHYTSPQPRSLSCTSRKNESMRLQGLSSWLNRSGNLPLSISLTIGAAFIPNVSPPVTEEIVMPYLKFLSAFSPRWRLISINLHGVDWIQHFFSHYKASDLPLLEKIHLDGSRCDVGKLTNAKVIKTLSGTDSFLQCPNLRWVSLPLLGELIIEVPVQWSRMTGLNLNSASHCSLARVMDILALCPELETLSICFDLPLTPTNMFLEKTVRLSRLRELCVVDSCTTYDSPRFFDHLYAPDLRLLWYNRSFPPYQWLSHIITLQSLSNSLFKSLRAFTTRTRQPIEELSLGYNWLMEDDLFKFLFLFPELKRLSLCGSGMRQTAAIGPFDGRSTPLLFDEELLDLLLTIPERQDIKVNVFKGNGGLGQRDEEESDDMGEGDNLARDNHQSRPTGIPRTTDENTDEADCQETYNFFCPQLEVFHCTGASFSVLSLLYFLRSRSWSDKRFGITRIRRVDVTFSPDIDKPLDSVLDEIRLYAEGAGIGLFLHFLDSEWQANAAHLPPHSPYDGLYRVGFGKYLSALPMFTGAF